MEFTIKKILNDKLVDDIYISTDNKETAKIAKKFGAKCPFIRPKNLADKSTDLISVAKHTLEKIEKKNVLPDLVYVVTESFPLREKNLLEMMLNKLKKNGLETIAASKKENAGIWLRDISKKKFKNIVDNITPGELRDNESFMVPFGLGHLTYAHVLRAGKFLDKNFDLYPVENSLSITEVKDQKSLKNLLKIIN
jgi:N-acylneuraminate cytidylyltransferase/CMP-N,N'-diacetyllegionaminic acid synthase